MPSAKGSKSRTTYTCSFCGKNQEQVRRLIAGPGAVYICDECVELCREIVQEDKSSPANEDDGHDAVVVPAADGFKGE